MKSFCLGLPIVLYGLEVTDPKKSVLAMLDNLFNIERFLKFSKSQKRMSFTILEILLDYIMLNSCVKRRGKIPE